jgi:putative FmdB family regulatory protein
MGVLEEQAFRKRQAERVRIAQNRPILDTGVCIMPTYEYECEKCRQTFEVFQSMKDAALTVCPKSHCRMARWGKGKVRRLLGTGAGIIFKGSGFYSTDYRSPSYKEAAQKEGSSSKPGAEKESSSSEKSKPAEKQSSEGSKPKESPKE